MTIKDFLYWLESRCGLKLLAGKSEHEQDTVRLEQFRKRRESRADSSLARYEDWEKRQRQTGGARSESPSRPVLNDVGKEQAKITNTRLSSLESYLNQAEA